jgi:NAD(P)-dependent dehydrogenase (short-subunit alcohol dehydrogenase family)
VGRIVTLPAEATGAAPGRGRLAGRRVLVVGAGTRPSPEPDPPIGNGRAISVLAAREGAAVACADRDAAAAEATASLVRNEGRIAAVVLADVTSPQACESVVAESAAALGGIDGLVLNVGVGLGRGMTGTTVDQWDETFAVNTRAHFLVAAAALHVLDHGSAIVLISSAASLRAATGIPAYDASKAALLGICRQVAREGMARGIRANLVVPSLVDTPLGREASRLNPARTARSLPFGRQATAWEVAYATVWLLSGESSYVNAHPLVLDGGATSFGLPPWRPVAPAGSDDLAALTDAVDLWRPRRRARCSMPAPVTAQARSPFRAGRDQLWRAVVQRSVQDLASLQYQRMSAHAWPPSGTSRPSGSATPHKAHWAASSGRRRASPGPAAAPSAGTSRGPAGSGSGCRAGGIVTTDEACGAMNPPRGTRSRASLPPARRPGRSARDVNWQARSYQAR